MNYEAAFGTVLQKLRLGRNLSQAELAEASQLDRTFISLLERGIRQPSLTTVFDLAGALKIKPGELIHEVEKTVIRARWRRIKK